MKLLILITLALSTFLFMGLHLHALAHGYRSAARDYGAMEYFCFACFLFAATLVLFCG